MNDKNPLVSVVVPTYSRSEMLLRALGSLNDQTYTPLEIVVVDDNGKGSNQQLSTQQRVEAFGLHDGVTLKYVAREKNGGGSLARNSGIEAASGVYVAFLDDDDEYLPRKVEEQVTAMEGRPEVGLSYVHCRSIDDDTGHEILYQRTLEGDVLFQQAYCGCIAATTQWMARRDALLAVEGFSETPAKQDSILLYKLLLAGYQIICVPEVLSVYHEHHTGRISSSGKTLVGERNYDRLIRQTYGRMTPNQRRMVEHAIRYRVGTLLWSAGDKKAGAGQMVSSFLFAPAAFSKKFSRLLGHVAKQCFIKAYVEKHK